MTVFIVLNFWSMFGFMWIGFVCRQLGPAGKAYFKTKLDDTSDNTNSGR